MDKYKIKDDENNVIYIPEEEESPVKNIQDYERKPNDLLAYWLLGFGNNFTYWVMITAAYDLITKEDIIESGTTVTSSSIRNNTLSGVRNLSTVATSFSDHEICLSESTGAILVADTVPAALVTILVMAVRAIHTEVRVAVLLTLCLLSYLVLGLAPPAYTLPGVALASLSRGLSDTTFLAHAAYYHSDVLSLWSSGTGVATFTGPLLYSGLTTAGVSSSVALLSFLLIPLTSAFSFWCILGRPGKHRVALVDYANKEDLDHKGKEQSNRCGGVALFMESLWRSLPLSVFYFVMYFTNQGLVDLVYFPNSSLTHAQQYSWMNTARGLGTLLSRSSHHFLLLPKRWMYNIIIILMMVAVLCEVIWRYLSTVYLLMGLLLLQGMIEGAAFRHTIYELSSQENIKKRNYYLSVFPSALFIPAVAAGFVAMPVHHLLCAQLQVLHQ